MNPHGNSAGGETPPSSQNQLQPQCPGQPPLIANEESHIINEPSLPLHAAGERRTPPSSSQGQLRIQEPRQPPLRVDNLSQLISEPSLQLYSAGGRTISPSFRNQLQHQRPPQHPLGVNQESHVIKKPPSSQNQLQFQGPRHAAGGRRTPPLSSQRQLRIQEPGQHPLRFDNLSQLISEPSLLPLYSAGERTMSPSLQNQLQHQRPPQYPLRINQESHVIKKPSSSQNQLQLQRPPQPPLRINEPSLPLHADGSAQQMPGRMPQVARPRAEPVIIYEKEAKVYHCEPEDFKDLVQRLTGQESSDKQTSGHGDVSPAVSIEETNPRKNERHCRTEGDAMTELERLEVGQFWGISSPTPIPVPLMDENNLFESLSGLQSSGMVLPPGISSPAAQSFAPAAPYGLSQVPNRVPLMDNVSPFVSENSFLGSLSGLQSSSMVSPVRISSPAAPNFAPAAPYDLSQFPNRVPLMDNVSPFGSENGFLGGLSGSSILLPPGMSSLVSPSSVPVLPLSVPDIESVMQDLGFSSDIASRETRRDYSRGASSHLREYHHRRHQL